MAHLMILDDLFSSSESEDSDLEIFDEVIFNHDQMCHCMICKPRIPRIRTFIEDVINNYNDFYFQQNFRLCRATFDYLLSLLRPYLENGRGRRRISAEKQLYITLWFLGTPDSYRSVTTKFGVSFATAWSAVVRVVFALCNLRPLFIKWPTAAESAETAQRIQARYRFPGASGAVDGTHIRIPAPKVDHEAYINRKGYHSLQLQVTCNDHLEFIHCYTGLPGSVHDGRVFTHSGLQQRCTPEFFPNDCHLLGDSAYTLQRCVMVPYRDNGHLTVEQLYFNYLLSSARMIVERAIGLLKGRWRLLLDKIPMKRTDLIPYFIMAACVLHNICLKCQDTFEFLPAIPDTHETDEPLEATNINKVEGNAKREIICVNLNE